jgi:hypothetical protein
MNADANICPSGSRLWESDPRLMTVRDRRPVMSRPCRPVDDRRSGGDERLAGAEPGEPFPLVGDCDPTAVAEFPAERVGEPTGALDVAAERRGPDARLLSTGGT